MKKKLIVLLLPLLVSGCGNNNITYDEDTESGQIIIQEATIQVESEEAQAVDYKGYAFVYNDVVMEINAPADSVLARLGEANSYFEAPSCAFNGIDKIYTYNSFELDTHPMDGKDFISSVLFKDDSVATVEGIGIGDPVEKLSEVYGEDSIEENGMTIYCKDGMKLCFLIEEGCISSIEYKTTILDE